MENYDSPLTKYKRTPKLLIDLPSKGNYYPKNVLEGNATEVEVYSLTASDEIRLKTPDALYTGKAVIEAIKHCVPAIKDPSMMPVLDVDYVLAAIRIASYGDQMNISSKCPNPECGEVAEYSIELQSVLDHFTKATFKSEIRVNDFLLRLRPLTYKELTEIQKQTITVQRTLVQYVRNLENEVEREEKIRDLYEQINQLQENVILSIVTEITTPEGEREMHHPFIVDFIKNGDPTFFKAVQEVYTDFNKRWAIPSSDAECPACKEKYQIQPTLDQSNFFGLG